MAYNELTEQFRGFFKCINPSPSYEKTASSEHTSIIKILEDASGPSAELAPKCFLQGSYKQDTAIHTINDVDIVALCGNLVHPGNLAGRQWSRHEIFDTLASSINADGRYRGKIQYGQNSMCVKIDLGIKIEILPAVKKADASSTDSEPFRIYDPDLKQWTDAYARNHQKLITEKNKRVNGLLKPMIKVFKHLRDVSPGSNEQDAISFHIECLLYCVPDSLFTSSIAYTVEKVLTCVANFSSAQATTSGITSPCGEKMLFSYTEWQAASYERFNKLVQQWSNKARAANGTYNSDAAINFWKQLLGDDYFPREV